MHATHLRAVHTLDAADTLQLGNDPRFFRVREVEQPLNWPDRRFRVTLRSVHDASLVTIVRGGGETVLAMEEEKKRA